MMDRKQARKRRDELLAKEKNQQCQWFWLSFASEEGFMGGCFVLAPGFMSAVLRAHDLGINPGGEVMGFPAPVVPPKDMQNRLLSKDDLEDTGGWVRI